MKEMFSDIIIVLIICLLNILNQRIFGMSFSKSILIAVIIGVFIKVIVLNLKRKT